MPTTSCAGVGEEVGIDVSREGGGKREIV